MAAVASTTTLNDRIISAYKRTVKKKMETSDDKSSLNVSAWTRYYVDDEMDIDAPPPSSSTIEDDEKEERFENTDGCLYTLRENDGKKHFVLKMPSVLQSVVNNNNNNNNDNVTSTPYNIVMVDASGSMWFYWDNIEKYFNNHLAKSLCGTTVLYCFSDGISFKSKNKDPKLSSAHFTKQRTNLVGALQTIMNEVDACDAKCINVFLITDGDDTVNEKPASKVSSVIEQMKCPPNKVCNVYILGVGRRFPIQYTIDIRSKLHNGNINTPSLFWAEETRDVEAQMKSISEFMSEVKPSLGSMMVELKENVHGDLFPTYNNDDNGSSRSRNNKFYFNEYVWLLKHPFVNDDDDDDKFIELPISLCDCSGKIIVPRGRLILPLLPVDYNALKGINQQLNNRIIQECKNGNKLHYNNILSIKKNIYDGYITDEKNKKKLGGGGTMDDLKSEFDQELRELDNIIFVKTLDEPMKLAESILRTTVMRIKKPKHMKNKRIVDEEFEKCRNKFLEVYRATKKDILKILVTNEDCCRITTNSTVGQLQGKDDDDDEDFEKITLQCGNLCEFIKVFCISGIPIEMSLQPPMTVNPWTYTIEKILPSPYDILSYNSMEMDNNPIPINARHRGIDLAKDIKFNAIIPVFSSLEMAEAMKPIVDTKLYQFCVTFALTKNALVVDYNVHMAALAVVWLRMLRDDDSEYIRKRMESVECTALLYKNKYRDYCNELKDENGFKKALMMGRNDGGRQFIKSETLVKPLFMLHLMNIEEKPTTIQQRRHYKNVIQWIIIEYIGRCMHKMLSSSSSLTEFYDKYFSFDFKDEKQFVKRYIENNNFMSKYGCENLFERFYTLDELRKYVKPHIENESKILQDSLLQSSNNNNNGEIKVNVEVLETEMKRVSFSTGDLDLSTLKSFARRVLGYHHYDDLFTPDSYLKYIVHCLRYDNHQSRLSSVYGDIIASQNYILEQIVNVYVKKITKLFELELATFFERVWINFYTAAHATEIVQPMSREQIIEKARSRNINVDANNFDDVYTKFRCEVGLLRNACQSSKCPYFLQPRKNYNQHATVERKYGSTFVHKLHNNMLAFSKINNNNNNNSNGITFQDYVNSSNNDENMNQMLTEFNSDIEQIISAYREMCIAQEDDVFSGRRRNF